MSTSLIFEPDFLEDAVFLVIHDREGNGSEELVMAWHRERERVYAIRDFHVRTREFRRLDEEWFSRLGLRARFEATLRAFPYLSDPSLFIRIRRAFSSKEEGSELYLQDNLKTNLLKIQTIRFLEDQYLERFLRHEWLRVSDMLDPHFQYSPRVALSGAGEVEDNLIRERFRILWDIYLSARLIKQGLEPLLPLDCLRQLFERAFSQWSERMRERIFGEIRGGKYQTQSELLKLAKDEKLTVPLGQGGLLCPLCHFTSFDSGDLSSRYDPLILQEIKKDNPDWTSDLGICRNCFEFYQSKIKIRVAS